MKCPKCGCLASKVVDSRPNDEGTSIRRRRECESCGSRFTTYEKIEVPHIIVIKKDNTRQAFDIRKLINGMIKSCEKRPVSIDDIESHAYEIEKSIQNSLRGEIKSEEIGNMVMDALKNLDEVSYVRYASVYRQFKDVQSFFDEIEEIINQKK